MRAEPQLLINHSGIVKGLISGKGNECTSCSLSRKSAGKLMAVPGLAGQYCSVLCAEQTIYERGCGWCGEKSASGKYCRDACQSKARSTRIGDGMRLRDWLRRQGALPVTDAPVVHGETCLRCGDRLDGKRSDASFCSERCRSAYRRESGKLENGLLARSSPQQNQQVST